MGGYLCICQNWCEINLLCLLHSHPIETFAIVCHRQSLDLWLPVWLCVDRYIRVSLLSHTNEMVLDWPDLRALDQLDAIAAAAVDVK